MTHNMQQAARVSDRTAFFTTEVSDTSDDRTGVLVESDLTEQDLLEPVRRANRELRHRAVRVTPNPGGSRTVFRDQMDEVRGEIVHLAGLVAEAIPRATSALLDADLDAARKLVDGDDVLDVLTLQIEEHCYHLLALQSPMASDLRAIITALRLASEIERCGDLTVNIAKAARRLYGVELERKLRGIIERMSRGGRAALPAVRRRLRRRRRRPRCGPRRPRRRARRPPPRLHRGHLRVAPQLRRRPARWACSWRSSAASTSASATMRSTSASGCSTWSPAGCPSMPAQHGPRPRGEVEAHAEETIHLEDYGESNGSANGSGTGPD